MNPDEFYPDPRERKQSYTFAYIVLALGVATIVAHYTIVLPYLASLGI